MYYYVQFSVIADFMLKNNIFDDTNEEFVISGKITKTPHLLIKIFTEL